MLIQKTDLENFNFIHTHDLAMDGDVPTFRRVDGPPFSEDASVYMWLSPKDNRNSQFDVLYVGKAGYGIERRLNQHRGGFVRSVTGKKNSALIKEWLNGARTLMVYVRVSESQEILGAKVSLYSAEEHAICDRYVPKWNRASFPGMVGVSTQTLPPLQDEKTPSKSAAPVFDDMVDKDEIVAFRDALPPTEQRQFDRLVELIGECDPNANSKVVRGYSHQPPRYNKIPMYVVGTIGRSGKTSNYIARIPLIAEADKQRPLTVIFPSDARHDELSVELFESGPKGDWRPANLTAFLKNPRAYLKLEVALNFQECAR